MTAISLGPRDGKFLTTSARVCLLKSKKELIGFFSRAAGPAKGGTAAVSLLCRAAGAAGAAAAAADVAVAGTDVIAGDAALVTESWIETTAGVAGAGRAWQCTAICGIGNSGKAGGEADEFFAVKVMTYRGIACLNVSKSALVGFGYLCIDCVHKKHSRGSQQLLVKIKNKIMRNSRKSKRLTTSRITAPVTRRYTRRSAGVLV